MLPKRPGREQKEVVLLVEGVEDFPLTVHQVPDALTELLGNLFFVVLVGRVVE